MFDLTWFCSHMFSTSGEHPLLPSFPPSASFHFPGWGTGRGVQLQCRSGLTSWVENWLPVVLAGYSRQSQGSTCPRYVGTPRCFSLA